MRVFEDVIRLEGIKMTKDTPKNDSQITSIDVDVTMITSHYSLYTIHTTVLVQRSVW